MIWLISILWAFIAIQQFMSVEGVDWSKASGAEKTLICFLFMIFGPCIMISNVILFFVEMICGNDDDDYFKRY